MSGQPIATLRAIYRYPVKSMRGELLADATVTPRGLPGDRGYALIDRSPPRDGKILTGRIVPEMLLYAARVVEDDTVVTAPDGGEYDVQDPALLRSLEARLDRKLEVRRQDGGAFDAYPVSIFSLDTLGRLEDELEIVLDRRRFRATFYVETAAGRPFDETAWLGRPLAIGADVQVRVTEQNERCKMITLDPDHAGATPAILTHIQRRHERCAGIYAEVLRTGVASVGDAVSLMS